MGLDFPRSLLLGSDSRRDISRELETELTDEYANEATPTDGEVYRKVRQYQYEASARFEERWLSRLTENKQKRMRQLSQPENRSIRSAFDSLLPIPGLWNGMSIGNLPRVIAVKCDEVRIPRRHETVADPTRKLFTTSVLSRTSGHHWLNMTDLGWRRLIV